MDEITLLRRTRSDVAEPTAEVMTRARARLLAHAAQDPQDRADHLRRSSPRRRPPYRVLALAGIAASLAAVFVYAPLGGQPEPAGAAEVLTEASQHVSASPTPSPGQYLKISTSSEALSYVTDDDEVTGAYVVRTVEENYVPADQTDEWIGVSYTLPTQSFYGDSSVREAARRDFAESAHVDEPTITRAAGGQFGNGELGGPSTSHATTAELPSLPRDPAELLRNLSARTDGADTSRSVTVMAQISTLLSSGLVDSDLTATMYRTLALLPDVEITEREATLGGRRGTAIGVTDDQGFSVTEVVIDLDAGRFLGIRTRQLEATGPVPAGTTTWSTTMTSRVVSNTP